jgi:hypothetical protein
MSRPFYELKIKLRSDLRRRRGFLEKLQPSFQTTAGASDQLHSGWNRCAGSGSDERQYYAAGKQKLRANRR